MYCGSNAYILEGNAYRGILQGLSASNLMFTLGCLHNQGLCLLPMRRLSLHSALYRTRGLLFSNSRDCNFT